MYTSPTEYPYPEMEIILSRLTDFILTPSCHLAAVIENMKKFVYEKGNNSSPRIALLTFYMKEQNNHQ